MFERGSRVLDAGVVAAGAALACAMVVDGVRQHAASPGLLQVEICASEGYCGAEVPPAVDAIAAGVAYMTQPAGQELLAGAEFAAAQNP